MSVTAIEFIVVVFPDPAYLSSGAQFWWEKVPENLAFDRRLTENLQTLSTNDADPDGFIQGLLYVPDIDPADPCYAQTERFLPQNVTRQANLPNTDFNIIALAPWINANCTMSFLAAAHFDPIRAFIFYIPDNGTAQPPPISSPLWNMNDGAAWKASNPFPVYAVPGIIGSQMMTQLSLYSGNLTTVPKGHTLMEEGNLDPRDYVRVFVQLDVTTQTSLPALWVFLLIVAGGLLFVLCSTSLLMHFIQRRRRDRLRRRIARGQVDLEALGIKRLTVPTNIIEKMPLFKYTCTEEASGEPTKRESLQKPVPNQGSNTNEAAEAADSNSQAVDSTGVVAGSLGVVEEPKSNIATQEYLQQSQPTCPICLEDFESGSTVIRELPCGHIFHPECIDNFLGNNSSLCPMCKKTTLPLGYCPERITNAMVRRERAIRRLRSRVTVNEEGQHVDGTWTARMAYFRSLRRQVFGGNDIMDPTGQRRRRDILELRSAPVLRVEPTWLERHEGLSRQEVAQQRVQEILGEEIRTEDPEVVEEAHQSRWRKFISGIFPGFK